MTNNPSALESARKKTRHYLHPLIQGILLVVLLIALSSLSSALPNEIALQGKLTNPSGVSQVGTFNMSFKIYDNYSASTAVYESRQDVTTNANGVYDVILRNITLPFDAPYYLGITIGIDNESSPRLNLTSSPYAFRSNITENLNPLNSYIVANLSVRGNITLGTEASTISITSQGINLTSLGSLSIGQNLSLGQRISFSFANLIESLSSGLQFTGNINAPNNFTGGSNLFFIDSTNNLVGIGTTSPNDRLEVVGNVRISGSLNASFINATQGLRVRGNEVQEENVAFKIGNLTGFLGVQNSSIIRTENISSFTRTSNEFNYANFTSNLAAANSSLSLWNVSGNNIYPRFLTGNVGIGNTIPNATLDISGNLKLSRPNGLLNISGMVIAQSGSDMVISD